MDLKFKLVWSFVALTAMVSTVNCGGNTFVPPSPIPEPMPLPSIPMEPSFEDTDSDPTNAMSPPQCVFSWTDVLKVFNPLNKRGNCNLNCAANQKKLTYTTDGFLGIGGFTVCCCVPLIELPSLPSFPSLPSIPSIPLPSQPIEPYFEDTESDPKDPSKAPQCVYSWADLLKVFNPLNQNGKCELNCAANEKKVVYNVGGLLGIGGRDVCCCLPKLEIPTLPPLPSIPSLPLPSIPSLSIPSIPMIPSFDDTDSDPTDSTKAPKCVYPWTDILKIFNPMNHKGNCELTCGDNERKVTYNVEGILGIGGHQVCCCTAKLDLPSIPPLPSIPSIPIPSIPMVPSFDDTDSDPSDPTKAPKCVYPWTDVLKVFNPLNQRGNCGLKCGDNEKKMKYEAGGFLGMGGITVCCCMPEIQMPTLPPLPSIPSLPLPSIPMGPSFDDTDSDPADPKCAPKCVYPWTDILKVFNPLNQRGNCGLKCRDNEKKIKYEAGGFLGMGGTTVCCCVPEIQIPTLPPLPSIPSLPLPSLPIVPSFDDTDSDPEDPTCAPKCVYPWTDILKVFDPLNQRGNCGLKCKDNEKKMHYKVGGFLGMGGKPVCCCVVKLDMPTLPPLPSIPSIPIPIPTIPSIPMPSIELGPSFDDIDFDASDRTLAPQCVFPFADLLHIFTPMNIHGNCGLKCRDNEEKKKYKVGGLLGIGDLLGLGHEVCCCIPARVKPTLPSIELPSIAIPSISIPSISLGPEFDDIDYNPLDRSLAPHCVYPFTDILHLFLPMNQHGNCGLKCADNEEKKKYKVGGLLGIGDLLGMGREVCCCIPARVNPTFPPLPSIELPSIAIPSISIPSISLGPEFDDIDYNPLDRSHAPQCVYPFTDILHLFLPMNQHGNCGLKCADNEEKKKYKVGGLLGIGDLLGMGREVCCCIPARVNPTLPPLPSIELPSIAIPSISIPSISLGPEFDDIDYNPLDRSHAPQCVYPFTDILHLFLPMNQHGNCGLKCADNEEKKKYKVGGLLGIGDLLGMGREVCCCIPARVNPTLPPLPSIELPSIAIPSIEIPSIGLGPSFDDLDFDPSDRSHAPQCVYPFADLLHIFNPMNINGNCGLKCRDNEEKKKYKVGGLLGMGGFLGMGREVCCCIPKKVAPTTTEEPTTTTRRTTTTEKPTTTTTKAPTTTQEPTTSFADLASFNGHPPQCVYPLLDLLKLFNPMNTNGDCNLNCGPFQTKKKWKVGAFLFFGGHDVCCCN